MSSIDLGSNLHNATTTLSVWTAVSVVLPNSLQFGDSCKNQICCICGVRFSGKVFGVYLWLWFLGLAVGWRYNYCFYKVFGVFGGRLQSYARSECPTS